MSRISIVCVSLRAGGTERIVSRIAEHLASKHEVTLVLLARGERFYSLRPEIRIVQPDFEAKGNAGWRWYPRVLWHLWKSLRQSRPELVLCFGEPIAPPTLLIATLAGFRCIVFNRASPLTSLKGLRGLANPLTYPLAWRVMVQTQRGTELLKRRYRFTRFEVWPNPVDVPVNVPPIEERSRRIINVGTLGGRKNQQTLVRTFASLPERAGWTLGLVGDGPDRAMLERLTADLGVANQVSFLGERKDVDGLLRDSRIFAFSSLTEGFPNALAEALAAGCACVSFDCPTGPADLIQHRESGLLVPNGDGASFQAALQTLVSDEAMQSRLSETARERILEFSSGHVFAKLDGLLDVFESEAA